MANCNCAEQDFYKGIEVKQKTIKLTRIQVGPDFGYFLYKCDSCNQIWEENLSQATRYDWPPILMKIDKKG